mmetsp:Transcript_18859/g.32227  ORF Transcript_18859/g.32227 Transcript_18859/m.32227 type:complete len:330 (-) Transcript_18859:105-1094(-)|eukprot:CAMPEP_0119107150 /NCGR_PEP_ID=MMETSP1180-20130426/8511_1 /TAXON_ID=3052 ORGANISM="Chlamydomonas cf sp, Strain CCMP681" /NCGR_SAMPLE_ID=MMETSP1180 /ASSEMBLY_ACC=CAM_ASM_000741 /LENGTH=329 /DNA_ID=CAMNT_0007092597 /DNA_START=48 /DNA_END=1037 /DNA_ORIENTATION=-
MALRQAASKLLGLPQCRFGASLSSSDGLAHISGISSRDESPSPVTGPVSHMAQIEAFVSNKGVPQLPLLALRTGSPLFGGARQSTSMPWAAGQTMAMSTAPQVQSGAVVNSLLLGVYRFWRSQAPMDKPPAAVDSRLLPSVIKSSDERANIGVWCTTLFFTILSCNLLGLTPFNEAPTSGLGFSTGLGVSVWATATAFGFYKMGHTFPGHFIPSGTPWPMAFIFVPLETISYSFRAISLGVRLWVNMLAGHTLLHILTGMSLAMPFSLPIYSSVPATFAVCCLLSALVGLEYLVAVLQSGVFSILSSVYVNEFNHSTLSVPLAKMVKHI